MPSKSSRDRLAFEPDPKKKKTPKQPPVQPQKKSVKAKSATRKNATERSIPEEVSKRMIRRMAFFSGIPTGLAMSSFFVVYWIVSHEWLEIPTAAVGAVTLGLFGLGVLGLSYGIFSTSWDEDRSGGLIGAQEFKTNFGRMRVAWREAKEAEKQAKKS